MASFKSPYRNPQVEAARLRGQFRSVSRRVEWRYRLRDVLLWVTVCAVATVSALAGVILLWHALP